MKSTPITYTKEMILARKAGLKTQTRRLAKFEVPRMSGWEPVFTSQGHGEFLVEKWPKSEREFNNFGRCDNIKCRYGGPGDELWVQEAYWINRAVATARGDRLMVEGVYLADDERFEVILGERESALFRARKTGIRKSSPGRFMYRSLSRGTDRITDLRVQRVNEISEEDATAEGVFHWRAGWDRKTAAGMFLQGASAAMATNEGTTAQRLYFLLWNSIHTKPGETWAANPFVFAITFDKIK